MSTLVLVGRPAQIVKFGDRYGVPNCGLVFKDVWDRLEDFQSPLPPLPPNFPRKLLMDALAATTRWNEAPWAAEVERKLRLNPDRSVRWKFDLLHSDLDTWSEDTAILGEPKFVRWTWGDKNVVAPVLRIFAAVANFFALP